MDIDSNKAKAFFQLALDKTFSKASKSLGISQPALSQKIARLEDELEVSLVIRTGREIALTDFGLELVRYYQTKIQLDNSFLGAISHKNAETFGSINIAGYSSITTSVIIPIIATINDSFEGFQFKILSKEIYDLYDTFKSGEVDFIIGTNEVKRENVVNVPIGVEENIHIRPLNNSNSDLPFLDHDADDSTTFDFFKIQKINRTFRRCYLDDIYGIIKGVENGIGQAIVSKHLVKNNQKVKRFRYSKKMETKIYFSYLKKVYYPKLHLKLIDKIIENFQSHLR